MIPRFQTAAAVARSDQFDPDAPAPVRYHAGPPFDALDVRPGRVLLIGAPPAAGKTTLVMQLVAGILDAQTDLRAVVANVEMSPADLLAKFAARVAEVPLSTVMDRTYTPAQRRRVHDALAAHAGLLDRLAFLEPPFELAHLAAGLDGFGATVAVVDYVQRFGHGKELREHLDGLMTDLRRLALAGAAVIAVSSVSRQRGRHGSDYQNLNVASFRGSAELEFGADSAYLLESGEGAAVLRCVKNRFGRPDSLPLRFDADHQRFLPGDGTELIDAVPGTRGGAKG